MTLRAVLLVAAGALCAAAAARAQSPMLDQRVRSALWVEAAHPFYSSGGPSALIITPGIRVALSRRLTLTADLPLVHASPPAGTPIVTARTEYGNPYLGLRWRLADGESQIELGGRLPLARPDAGGRDFPFLAGVYGDYDRFEAWIPDAAAVQARVTKTSLSEGGIEIRVGFGGKVTIPVRSNSGERAFLFGTGSAFVGWMRSWFELLAGITATARLNGRPDPTTDAVNEQIEIGAVLRTRYAQPSVGVRIPLSDELSSRTHAVLEAGLVVALP